MHFIRRLLQHLESIGFDGAPRWLGEDEQRRNIFSFIEGDTVPDLGHFSDNQLGAAAHLIRRFHDASIEICAANRVACHNDLSPCKFVFRNDVPVAIIDFDSAQEWERNYDLGYAAWLWLDIGNPEYVAEEQKRRLDVFVGAYDDQMDPSDLVESMVCRQTHFINDAIRRQDAGAASWGSGCREWTIAAFGFRPNWL